MIDNDEKWLKILRGLNQVFYHKTVDYNDILGYMSQESGINLDKTFEQYVRRTSIPTLEVIENNPGVFMIRWNSEVEGFDMPVHIFDKDGKRQLINPTDKFKVMRLEGLTKENFKVDTFNYYIGVTIQ
jgi:aminopeptidase N